MSVLEHVIILFNDKLYFDKLYTKSDIMTHQKCNGKNYKHKGGIFIKDMKYIV